MLVSVPLVAGQTQPVLGLQLNPNQDTYQLPLDFLAVEPASWSVAVGERPSYRVTDAYYDESQVLFGRLNSTGYGRSQGWSTYSGAGYPIYGNAFAQPSKSGLNTDELVFDFTVGDISFMRMSSPATTSYLLTFNYYGVQHFCSIPNSELEAISLYAQYVCLLSRANGTLARGDVEIEDYKEVNSKIAAGYKAQAMEAYTRWADLVKYRVYCTAG